MDDDILEQYRLEAAAAMEVEAKRRIAETTDVEQDENLRNSSLDDVEEMVPALLARLGQVRAALDGHGGGISVTSSSVKEDDGYSFRVGLDRCLPVLWRCTWYASRSRKRLGK